MRGACVLTDGEKFLICHAPNRKHGKHTWDLPKGHCNEREPYSTAALRELQEETGLTLKDLNIVATCLTEEYEYGKGYISFLVISLEEIPAKELYCDSTFDTGDGTQLPEVNEYKWCDFCDLETKLYPKLSEIVPKMLIKYKKIWKRVEK